MKQDCFQPDELDRVCSAPADDGRLAHADECGRCRTLLLAYRNFRDSDRLAPEGADPDDADSRLSEWRAKVIGAGHSESVSWLQRLMQPVIARPAFAAAAVVVAVIAGTVLLVRPVFDPGPAPLRGGSDTAAVLELLPVSIGEDGQWRLRWTPAPGAEAYRVHLYSDGLEPLAELGPVTRPEYLTPARDLELELPGGSTIFWRVSALRGDDVIAESDAASFQIP